MMYDIITFGSAAQDVSIKSAALKILDSEKDFSTGQGICLPFGSKIDVQDVNFTTGGGGTNTAATFARQGFKTAFCGAIGADIAGLEIIRELRHLKIDTKFIVKKRERKTNISVILSGGAQDRTILVYRGASELLSEKDIPWKKIKKADWFYLAPVTGLLCDNFGKIVDFAKENNIKVAVNPSKQQLNLPKDQLNGILKKVDVLFLNQEEASILSEVDYKDEAGILKTIDKICPGVVVITKGNEGAVASEGGNSYSVSTNLNRKIVDTTGAGDSFASGFLSNYIRYNGNIEKSMQLGIANSEANLAVVGAKDGILSKKSKYIPALVTKKQIIYQP